jgi:plasmid stability protein
MSDLLIRNVDPSLRRRIKERAQRNERSMSDELKDLVRSGLETKPVEYSPIPPGKLGTYMFSLVPEEFRGDDLVFEREEYQKPVEFE